MLKALITGIDGFTGRYLAAELHQAGYEVFGIVNNPLTITIANVKKIYTCDLCNKSELIKTVEKVQPNVVAHLAAITFVAHGDVEEIYRTNIVGTRNLLEALSAVNTYLKCVLIASSANIYGNASEGLLDENTVPSPSNDYAVSKLAMEYMTTLWLDKLPITVVRPFNYTGVGQSLNFLIPKIVDHFKRLAPIIELGNLDVIRDFSDVRSVVKSYRNLIEIQPSGEIYNICSGHGHSLIDILQIMRRITGHDPDIRINPNFVRANEVHCLIGSREKLNHAVGTLTEIPLSTTLKWMIENKEII